MTNPLTLTCQALLFDMDGTILDSITAANRSWSRWAVSAGLGEGFSLHGPLHGRQRPDVVAELLPHLPEAEVAEHAETIRQSELRDVDGIVALPGAVELLSSLPSERWAVVTAADEAVARARIGAAGLPQPPILVSADDLDRGKPDPQGYLLGARRLGVAAESCVVFEDATAGLEAAHRARMRAIATRWTTSDDALSSAEVIVDDLTPIRVRAGSDGLEIAITAR